VRYTWRCVVLSASEDASGNNRREGRWMDGWMYLIGAQGKKMWIYIVRKRKRDTQLLGSESSLKKEKEKPGEQKKKRKKERRGEKKEKKEKH
jgi:hypothetical protein